MESNWDSFKIHSIDSKKQKVFEKFDENRFEFDLFDLIPHRGCSQIIRNWIRLKFLLFDSKICNLIEYDGEK